MRAIEYEVEDGQVMRLLASLTHPKRHPALAIACLYAAHWHAEIAKLQVKNGQPLPGRPLRSHHPDQVHQEIWAHLTQGLVQTRFDQRTPADAPTVITVPTRKQ